MTTRTRRPFRLLLVLSLAVVSMGLLAACSSSDDDAAAVKPAPELADPSRTGERLITEWLDALQREDLDAVGAILAPNFQIQRADGTSADRAAYLENPAKVTEYALGPEIVGLQDDDTLSVRWSVEIDEVIDGQRLSRGNAGRLTGFHWNGERWQIVTYANFNLPEAD